MNVLMGRPSTEGEKRTTLRNPLRKGRAKTEEGGTGEEEGEEEEERGKGGSTVHRATGLESMSVSKSHEEAECDSSDDDTDGDEDDQGFGRGDGSAQDTENQFDALMQAVRKQVEAQLGLEPGTSRAHSGSNAWDPSPERGRTSKQGPAGSGRGAGISKALQAGFAAPIAEHDDADSIETHVSRKGSTLLDELRHLFSGRSPNETEQIEIYSQRISEAARSDDTTISSKRLSQQRQADAKTAPGPAPVAAPSSPPARHGAEKSSSNATNRLSNQSRDGVVVPIDDETRRQEQRTDLLSPAQRIQAAVDPSVFAKMAPGQDGEDDQLVLVHRPGTVKRKMKTGLKKATGLFKHSEQPAEKPAKEVSEARQRDSLEKPDLGPDSSPQDGQEIAISTAPAKDTETDPGQSSFSAGAVRLLHASTDVLDRLTGKLADNDEIASEYEPSGSTPSSDILLDSEKGFQPGHNVKHGDRARNLLKDGCIDPVTETELVERKTDTKHAKQGQPGGKKVNDTSISKSEAAEVRRQRQGSVGEASDQQQGVGAYPTWWQRFSATTANGLGLGKGDEDDTVSISTMEQERRAQQLRAFEKMEIEKFTRNFSKHVKEVRTLAFGNEEVFTGDRERKPFVEGRLDTLPTRWTDHSRMPRAEDFLLRDEENGKVSDRVDWIAFTIAYILCLLEHYTKDTLDEEPLQPYRMSTFRSHVERFYIVAPAWENILYGIRDLYRWKDPKNTARYAMTYFIFWYLNLLPSAMLLWGAYHICRFRYFPPTASALAEHVRKRRDRGIEAMRLSERLRRQTRLEVYELYLMGTHKFGAHGQMLLGDFVDLCEMVKNLILWRRPNASVLTTARFVVLAIAFAIAPADILYQMMTLSFGIWFFTIMPLASHFPRYRRALNPFWWLLWGAPTDAQYCIEILRKEAEVGIYANGAGSEDGFSNTSDLAELAQLGALKTKNGSGKSANRHAAHTSAKSDVLGTHFCFHKLLPGYLYIHANLIKFKALHGLAPKRKLCQVALNDIVGIKKAKSINLINLYASQGLEISLKDGSTIAFANMARRDQAFNKLIAVSSKDHLWKKV